jgi:hypothetical protein
MPIPKPITGAAKSELPATSKPASNLDFIFFSSFFLTTYATYLSNQLANLKLLKNQASAFLVWPRVTARGGFRPGFLFTPRTTQRSAIFVRYACAPRAVRS